MLAEIEKIVEKLPDVKYIDYDSKTITVVPHYPKEPRILEYKINYPNLSEIKVVNSLNLKGGVVIPEAEGHMEGLIGEFFCIKDSFSKLKYKLTPLYLDNVNIYVLSGKITADVAVKGINENIHDILVYPISMLWRILRGCPEDDSAYLSVSKFENFFTTYLHKIMAWLNNAFHTIGEYTKSLTSGYKFGVKASYQYKISDVWDVKDFLTNLYTAMCEGHMVTYHGFNITLKYQTPFGSGIKNIKINANIDLPIKRVSYHLY